MLDKKVDWKQVTKSYLLDGGFGAAAELDRQGFRAVPVEYLRAEDDMSPRWTVIVTYLTEQGPVDVEHDIVEIGELHGIIERGPSWNAITGIHIVPHERYLADQPRITIEHSKTQ